MSQNFDADVQLINAIAAVPSILDVICQATGMGFACVARVTEDRWIACQTLDRISFGLGPGGELDIKSTLCNEVRESELEIVIDDVATDPIYANHHTPRLYGLRSYIAVPILLGDGSFFGTLCAIDPKPAKLKETSVVGMFRLFAQLIARSIEDHSLLVQSQVQLAESLETAEARERFIAVLGHDLRNPLAAFQGGVRLLQKESPTAKTQMILSQMEKTADRMLKLVGHMLDFARGRLGGGIAIGSLDSNPLSVVLDQIVAEEKAAHPTRQIEVKYHLQRDVPADQARLAQLFSNLLGNAIAYGSNDRPIRVRASTGTEEFELSVANAGDPIPPDALKNLFHPFHRGAEGGRGGLGLGLYIAVEIAKAHGGTIDVVSNLEETKFTFRMPLGSEPPAP